MLTNTDMKVLKSSHISPFGGLNFVIKELDRLGVGSLLREHLPDLAIQSRYEWRDLFYSFWSIIFCGGDCAEDIAHNFKKSLSNNPSCRLPSPDRILDRMKQLVMPSIQVTAPRGKSKHIFSHNNLLNKLNIRILKRLSTFKNKGNILDYDNTLLFSHKADANMTYKKQFGYAPGVGIMGKHIVYVENRNGNSNPETLQPDTLQRMFDLLASEKISVDKFRADGASYHFLTLDIISRNVKKFYIRTRMSQSLQEAIEQIDNWQKIQIGEETIYRGETKFIPFYKIAKRQKKEHLLKSYRLVITKIKRTDGQINLFTGEAFNYHGIITNDEKMSVNQVVDFYNQRGAIEKEFDVLKNDFGWNNMPFSRLEQNLVFLIITAICRNLYHHVITTFSKRYNGLSAIFRLKKFIFRFICIPAKWIKQSRTWKLRMYGGLPLKT